MSDYFERKAERLIRAAIKTVRFRTGKCTGEDLSEFFTDSEKRSQLITGFMPLEPEEEREAVSVTAQAILKGWIRRHHAELEPVRSIPFCPFCNRERAEDTGSTFDYWA